jgi:phenylpyruvate tautomerase PptA (4-oxalocrotonate tautomerase family)
VPLVHVYMVKGRDGDALRQTLDAIHRVVVSTFKVPMRDRYQIVHERDPSHFIVEDTGLGITRSDKVLLIHVISRPRTRAAKVEFYRAVCEVLQDSCDVSSDDIVVTFTTNDDEDWSFGRGRAQFLTGEL